MVLQSRNVFRLPARLNVRMCYRYMQTVSAAVSGKPRAESLKNSRDQAVFPVHEFILTQIRHDVLLKDAYEGRVVDKKKIGRESLNCEPNVSNLSVSSLTQKLQALAHQEVVDFIKDLAHSALSEETFDTDINILQIVENECCLRARNWDSASLLLVTDAFCVLHYRCSHYLSAMFREFEHRWTSMAVGKEDVVQLAMCIIMGRKFPRLLVRNIENFVNSSVEEFSAGELSVICLAFFITNTSFRNVDVMEKLANAVLHSLPSASLKVHQLGSILKALRHAQFSKLSFYNRLGRSLSSSTMLQTESSLNDLSNIAFTYASLRISSPALFTSVSTNAVRLIQNRSRVRLKDVGRIVWSFALLQEPLDRVVQNQLLILLRRDLHLMEQFSQAFVEALLGLAMLQTYPLDLLQRLFSTEFPKDEHGVVIFAVLHCTLLIAVCDSDCLFVCF